MSDGNKYGVRDGRGEEVEDRRRQRKGRMEEVQW